MDKMKDDLVKENVIPIEREVEEPIVQPKKVDEPGKCYLIYTLLSLNHK